MAGLVQVLADPTMTYVYGNGRIAQANATSTDYFLPDALGSVRQLANSAGSVTLAQRYDPFGNPLSSAGSGTSVWAFAGEMRDATGLEYLRARYYAPTMGRFTTRDVWGGDANAPMSYNPWLYVYANPVNKTDAAGRCPSVDDRSLTEKERVEAQKCWAVARRIVGKYPNVQFNMGGFLGINLPWKESDLLVIEKALGYVLNSFDNDVSGFERAFPQILFARRSWNMRDANTAGEVFFAAPHIVLYDGAFKYDEAVALSRVIHEMGHVLDYQEYRSSIKPEHFWVPLSAPWHWGFTEATGGSCDFRTTANCLNYCQGPNVYVLTHGDSPKEDFADGFYLWVFYRNPGMPYAGFGSVPSSSKIYQDYKAEIDYMSKIINYYRHK